MNKLYLKDFFIIHWHCLPFTWALFKSFSVIWQLTKKNHFLCSFIHSYTAQLFAFKYFVRFTNWILILPQVQKWLKIDLNANIHKTRLCNCAHTNVMEYTLKYLVTLFLVANTVKFNLITYQFATKEKTCEISQKSK